MAVLCLSITIILRKRTCTIPHIPGFFMKRYSICLFIQKPQFLKRCKKHLCEFVRVDIL